MGLIGYSSVRRLLSSCRSAFCDCYLADTAAIEADFWPIIGSTEGSDTLEPLIGGFDSSIEVF